MQTLARRGVLRMLGRVRDGGLVILDGAERLCFGAEVPNPAVIEVHRPGFWTRAAFGGEIGFGESYMAGDWSSPDLVQVVRFAVRNLSALEFDSGLASLVSRIADRWLHRSRANDVAGSRENIHRHYDLGNDFYRLFLDESLAYSCAVYREESDDLHAAQLQKFDLICQKLRLGPNHHLLEIGTGWGGFAAHAVQRFGCRVTTTTISAEQHRYAAALFQRLGIDDRVTLLQEDYRNLRGTFDRIVSIEMFEAVGLAFYDDYFAAIERLLAPQGTALIQTITMNERNFPGYSRRTDWIQKHIFPGAELASVSEVQRSLARTGSLNLFHLEDIGTHYARTLHAWRERFHARLDDVRRLGFDETFIRKWDYYLAYCEGAFAERWIGDAQLLLARISHHEPLWGEPWTHVAS